MDIIYAPGSIMAMTYEGYERAKDLGWVLTSDPRNPKSSADIQAYPQGVAPVVYAILDPNNEYSYCHSTSDSANIGQTATRREQTE